MYTPFKMKGKSPMMKALVGKQNNLPEHLKAKIKAAPESPAKMNKKSAAKMAKKSPAKDYKKSLSYRLKGKAGRAKMDAKYSAGESTKLQKDVKRVTSKVDKGIQTVLNNPRGKSEGKGNTYVPFDKTKKKTEKVKTTKVNKEKTNKKKTGKTDWTKAPKVGSKERTQWYKDNNLKLDDTTPALMKKSAMKMKKSPATLIKKKTTREKLNKLVEKRTKLRDKKVKREGKEKNTKRVDKKLVKNKTKINSGDVGKLARQDAKKAKPKKVKKDLFERMTPTRRKAVPTAKRKTDKTKRERGN